jgi:hypothetical protein
MLFVFRAEADDLSKSYPNAQAEIPISVMSLKAHADLEKSNCTTTGEFRRLIRGPLPGFAGPSLRSLLCPPQ